MILPSDRILTLPAGSKKAASGQGSVRRVRGPTDDPAEPRFECPGCGARYYGRGAALDCLGYHLLAGPGRDE